MRKLSFFLLAPALALFNHSAIGATNPSIVELQTNLGTITIQLENIKAPISTQNFITYAQSGFYKNTLIHRSIKGFVVQGGGFDKTTGQQKTTKPTIKNEASKGLSNIKGTIAMARLSKSSVPNDPKGANTATSQFFFNLVDNKFLDYLANKDQPAGYAVFGKVIKGIEIVNLIGNSNTFNADQLPFTSNSELIFIENAYVSASVNALLSTTRLSVVGQGKVTSVPAGIVCGTACTKSQPSGAALKLTAIPAAGYQFGGWRGDCQGFASTLSINTKQGNHNCTAQFYKIGAITQ